MARAVTGRGRPYQRWFRQEHDQLGISHLFPISWIPVFDTDGAGELCADTAGAGPAPLHVLDEGYIEPPPPHFASLADFVQTAIRAFDAGLVRLSAVRPGAPSLDDSALEGDLRRLAYW
jgi:hypothetical protein